jgi:hypothetical protein
MNIVSRREPKAVLYNSLRRDVAQAQHKSGNAKQEIATCSLVAQFLFGEKENREVLRSRGCRTAKQVTRRNKSAAPAET